MSRQEEIRKEAKKIMDEFMDALDKVKSADGEIGFEAGDGTRKPKSKKKDSGFRERMLDNAPKSKDGFLVAEKKKW